MAIIGAVLICLCTSPASSIHDQPANVVCSTARRQRKTYRKGTCLLNVLRFFGVWCLDLSVGCLELSVGCLELSVWCLELSDAIFPYIWPLAGPNIAEKGAAIVEKLWEGFGKVLEKAKLSSRDQVGC